MRWGQIPRNMTVALVMIVCAALPPLGVAADAPRSINMQYFITRLGVPEVTPPPTPAPATKPAVQSFRFTGHGQITIANPKGTVSLTMNGEFSQPNNAHMIVTLTDPSSSRPFGPLEVVVIGQTTYVHFTGSDSPTGKDVWVLVDNPSGVSRVPGANLPNLANVTPPTTRSQTIGDEMINDTLTTHTRTTIDATALLGGSSTGAKPSTLTLDTWTGKTDNFPRRVTVNGTLSIDPAAAANLAGTPPPTSAAGLAPIDLTLGFTMDFTDFNAPVTITAPTSYTKLSDLLKQ